MPEVVIKSDTAHPAPILPSLSDRKAAEDFLTYIREQIVDPSLDMAAHKEAERLSHYWAALEKRLARGAAVEKGGTYKPSVFTWLTLPSLRDFEPADTYVPGRLKTLFTKAAKETRAIALSEVALCPAGFLDAEELTSTSSLGDLRIMTETTKLDPHNPQSPAYGFGFIDFSKINPQSHGAWDKYDSTIALPVLTLDDEMMECITRHHPEEMMSHLRTIITLSNHDMMHNFINANSKSDNSRLFEISFKSRLKRFMEHKTGRHKETDPLGFESALTVGHARTWKELEDTETGAQMRDAVEHFYDELSRISAALKEDDTVSDDLRLKAIDYFATAVPYALARLVSLNDPLMERAFACMEELATEGGYPTSFSLGTLQEDPAVKRILQNYKRAGEPLVHNEDPDLSYIESKKLQIAAMLPEIAILLSPSREGSPENKAHARSDHMDRMILTIIGDSIPSP